MKVRTLSLAGAFLMLSGTSSKAKEPEAQAQAVRAYLPTGDSLVPRREKAGFAAWGVIGLSCIAVDDILRDAYSNEGEGGEFLGTYIKPLGGEWAPVASMALLGLSGWISKDPDRARLAVWQTEAFLVCGMAVQLLKFGIARARPGTGEGPKAFFLFDDAWGIEGASYRAFPSGHAATAFTWAAVLDEYYHKPWLSILA